MSEFWDLSLQEVLLAIEAHTFNEMALWHMVRTHAAIVVQPHTKRRVKPESLIKLPIDDMPKRKRRVELPNVDEVNAFAEKIGLKKISKFVKESELKYGTSGNSIGSI